MLLLLKSIMLLTSVTTVAGLIYTMYRRFTNGLTSEIKTGLWVTGISFAVYASIAFYVVHIVGG